MQTFDLKPIHQDAVPAALEKAAWYRALHEPLEAESICRDVLAVDPGNQEAIRTLLLALTDQFGRATRGHREALELAGRFEGEYERKYYAGSCSSGWPRHSTSSRRPARATRPTKASFAQWRSMRRPSGSGLTGTTMRSCGGTRAPRFLQMHPDVSPAPAMATQPVELE